MTGTLLNVATIVGGAGMGVALGGRLPERTRSAITDLLGLFVVVLGLSDALTTFGPELAVTLGRGAVLVVLGSLLVGGIVGQLIDVEQRLELFGVWLRERTSRSEDSSDTRARFLEGFVMTSLIVCVGPLAVLGALQDGLNGDIRLLAIKSVLDGSVAVAFASALGIGVAFAAIPLLLWQGGLTLLAGAVGAGVSEVMVASLTAVGGFLVMGIGLRLLEIRPVRVANLLPALLIAPLVVALWP